VREGQSPIASELNKGVWREQREAISPAPDRVTGQPQERQHSAAGFGGTRDRLPPARGSGERIDELSTWFMDRLAAH
jgi:hypothetical protein